MRRLLIFSLLSVVVFSCNNSEEQDKVKKDEPKTIVGVQTLFNEDNFTDQRHLALLKELRICSEFQKDTSNYMEPACSPRFFRVLSISDVVPVENAFIVQIKAMVGGINLRRSVVLIRERGELVKANTFVANLIGFQKSKSGYNDLILRFNDNIEGEIIFYNCIFQWNKGKYNFKSCELIEGATWRQRIKPEFKDSVSNDIRNTLIKNQMIL
jgi:hypothetical protein